MIGGLSWGNKNHPLSFLLGSLLFWDVFGSCNGPVPISWRSCVSLAGSPPVNPPFGKAGRHLRRGSREGRGMDSRGPTMERNQWKLEKSFDVITTNVCVFLKFFESWNFMSSLFSENCVLIVGFLKFQNFISRFNASEQWKKGPLVVKGICRGFCVTTHLCGDYFMNHGIRIPSLNNQYDSKIESFVFFVAHFGWSLLVWISEHQWIVSWLEDQYSNRTPTYPWSIPQTSPKPADEKNSEL